MNKDNIKRVVECFRQLEHSLMTCKPDFGKHLEMEADGNAPFQCLGRLKYHIEELEKTITNNKKG